MAAVTSPNTAYAAHSVRPNFGFAETSHTLETGEIEHVWAV